MKIMNARILQCSMITLLMIFSWITMQAAHEAGHISAGFLSGGILESVELKPWKFSMTSFRINPHPLFTAAAGPLIGIVLALLIYFLLEISKFRYSYVFRFLAAFCLMSNGIYIGIGGFFNAGDAFDLLRNGVPLWCLWFFGAVSIPAALYMWHGEWMNFSNWSDMNEAKYPAFIMFSMLAVILFLAEWI